MYYSKIVCCRDFNGYFYERNRVSRIASALRRILVVSADSTNCDAPTTDKDNHALKNFDVIAVSFALLCFLL